MRTMIAVLVLVGCAVGQDNNSVMFGPAQPEPQCGKGDASVSYYLSGGQELKQGRCYKLKHYKAGCVMAAGMKPPEIGLEEIPCASSTTGQWNESYRFIGLPSSAANGAPTFELAHPGDCYRVKQDGTMEKVAHCDNVIRYADLVESEPVDVPAVMKDVESSIIVPKPCPRPVEDGLLGCFDRPTYSVPTCTDKSRILLTAEDGKHWCHKVQP